MREIEFVSYDGKFPNLCNGVLTIKVDGVLYSLKNCLMVNGFSHFDPYADDYRTYPWTLDTYNFKLAASEIKFTKEEVNYLEKLCNEHIPHGHCGGCN
nr:MAG TPA: hypothetical protein [Caudoviricetes sp.]